MKSISEILTPIDDTSQFKAQTTEKIKVDVPVVNKTFETNISDPKIITKEAIIEEQKVSENNFAQNIIVQNIVKSRKSNKVWQTLKAVPSTIADMGKNALSGGILLAGETLGEVALQIETIQEKGIGQELLDTASQVIKQTKDYSTKEIARQSYLKLMPKLITEYLPSIAELKDEKYIPTEKDKDFLEKKKLYSKIAVENAVIFNKFSDRILSKTGLTKTEKDGLAFDISSFATSSFMSLVGLMLLRSPKLLSAFYALMTKSQTTMEQMSRGNTPEESLRIGNINATFSGLTELYGLTLVGKWFLSPEVKSMAKQPIEQVLKDLYKTSVKVRAGQIVGEEGLTGAVQEVGNIYSGEWLGKGNDQTFVENLTQIGIAGALEGLGGLVGGSPLIIHYAIKQSAYKLGATEEEAQDVADKMTMIVSQQASQMANNFVNEATKNITPEEESKIAQQLTEGLESIKQTQEGTVQQEEIPTVIKGALFAKTQNQEQSDKMAEVLQSTIELHEEVSGVDRENLTDKELLKIQTSDFEQLDYLFNILNTEQTQEQIVNNASNLFLQTALKARETEVGKRAEITNEIDLFIGKPTDNQYSQEQKAKLQEAFYNYLITGKAKSTSQNNLFDLMKSQLNKTYFNLSEKNMLDEKTEVAYNSLIKELNPKLTKRELTEQLANDLKEEIVKLKQGKPTNLENVKIIKELLDFGKSFYNKNASEEDIQLFQNYAEFYRKVFNDLGNLQGVKNIVNQLEEKGLFTFDETKYNSLLNTLVKAEKRIKEVMRNDTKDLRDKFNSGLSTLNTMLNRLEDIGIKSKNLNDFVLSINPNANTTEELLSGIQQVENAFFETKNLLSQKYVSSEYYKILKKNYEKPEINFANIKIKVQTALSKFIADINSQTLQDNINENSLMTVNKILKELKGFEPEIENKIKNTLLKAKTIDDVYYGIDKILFEVEQYVNKEYVKRVNKKIKNQIADLTEKAKEGDLQIEDNIFVNNLFNFGKNFNKKIEDKIAIELENQDSIYTIAKKDVADIESQIGNSNLSTEELAQAKSDLVAQKRLLNSLETDLIDELIYTDTKVEQFTENTGKPFQVSDRQQTLANAYLKYIYNNKVNNKDAVDNLYQLYKVLDKFSNEVLAEENARFEAEQKEIIDTKDKMIKHLEKTKSFWLFNKFINGMADIGNVLESLLGQEAYDSFDTTVAETRARNLVISTRKQIHAMIKKVSGKDYYNYAINAIKTKLFTNSKNKILKEMDLSKAEAMYYYILSKNEKGLVSVLNTVGREGLNEIETRLTTEDMIIMDNMSKTLESLYPQINEAYMAIHNKPMGKEEVYFTILHEFGTQIETAQDVNDRQSLFSSKMSSEPSFVFNRVKNTRKLAKVNPFVIFDKYIDDASMFIHVSPKMNKLSKILNNENIQNELKAIMLKKFGDKSFDSLQALVENINGTVLNNRVGWLTGEKKLNFIVNNLIVAKTMGKMFTAFKQLASISLFAELMPTKTFMKHLAYSSSNFPEVWKEMMQYNSIKDRYQFVINDRIVNEAIALDQKYLALQKMKNASTYFVRFFDAVSVVTGGYAYKKHLESLNKYTAQQIEDKVVGYIEDTQQSPLKSSQGLYQFQTKNAITKGLMAYRTAQIMYFRKAMMTVYRMQNGTITKEEGLKTLAIYLLVNPLIFGAMSLPATAISFLLDPSDDDNKEEIYKLFLRPIASQLLSAHYITDVIGVGVLDTIAKKAGQKTYTPFTANLIIFDDVVKAFGALSKATEGDIDEEEAFKIYTRIMAGLQPFTAVPITPVMKMLGGSYDILEGDFVEGIMNILNVPQSEIDKALDN